MNNEGSTFKACKYCDQQFKKNEIFNHQRSCNAKQKQTNNQDNQQPQINNVPKSEETQSINNKEVTNIQLSKDQTQQLSCMHYTLPDKFKDRVTIVSVKPLIDISYNQPQIQSFSQYEQPKQNFGFHNDKLKYNNNFYQAEQPQSNMNFNQELPKNNTNFYQQQSIQNTNLQPIYNTNLLTQQEQPKNLQLIHKNNQPLHQVKCEHCNIFVNFSDIEKHKMNCSSCLRFNELIQQINQEQQIYQNSSNPNKEIMVPTNQQILSEYLILKDKYDNILTKGTQLLDLAMFKSLKFKNTFDQRYCFFCKKQFREDQIIYNFQCCLIKCDQKCLQEQVTKSTKCYNCQFYLFPFKQQQKK